MADVARSLYLRGAFLAYDPGTYPGTGPTRRIPFRFNPETLSRSLSVEQAQSDSGAATGSTTAEGSSGDAASGVVKESFTVQVRFDFDDREEANSALDPTLGVLPEIAALEDLLHPPESATSANSDGQEGVAPRPERCTVLFVWGMKRVMPVRITSMNVNETMFNALLNPVRAEVDVSLEVLGESDARNSNAVRDALAFTASKRREMARMYYEAPAAQTTLYPDFGSQETS